jgi:hypothetical protein
MTGTFTSSQQVSLSRLILSEFGRHCSLPLCHVRVFFTQCRYDIILGRDILRQFRLTLDFDKDLNNLCALFRQYPSHLCTLAQQLELNLLDSHLTDETFSDIDNPLPARAGFRYLFSEQNNGNVCC